MKKNRDFSFVFGIPGGWYGNDPGFLEADPKLGNVVIAADRIVDALSWLKKHANILTTSITTDPNPGILIRYESKRK